jgi:DNA-binding GntR family transcriptional regulator
MHSGPSMNTWTIDELARVHVAITALNSSHGGIVPLDRLAQEARVSRNVLRDALEALERADLVDLMIDSSFLTSRVRRAGYGWLEPGRGYVAYVGARR